MFRQQFARVTARRTAHHVFENTGYIATPRKAFSAGVQRRAEVEITIDGKKVMIEQVRILSYPLWAIAQVWRNGKTVEVEGWPKM